MNENISNQRRGVFASPVTAGKLQLGNFANKSSGIKKIASKPSSSLLAPTFASSAKLNIAPKSTPQIKSVLNISSKIPAPPLRNAFGKTEDKSIYEWRKEQFIGEQNGKIEAQQRKRQSMMKRGKVAIAQREVTAKLQQVKFEEEKSFVESRKENFHASLEYKASIKKKARESLASRLVAWKHHRSVDERNKQLQMDKRAEYAEWQRQDWQSHEEYKRGLVAEQKGNLAALMDQWKRQKEATFEEEARQREVQAVEAQLLKQELAWKQEHESKAKALKNQELALQANEWRERKDAEERRKDMERAVAEAERTFLAEERKYAREMKEQTRAAELAEQDLLRLVDKANAEAGREDLLTTQQQQQYQQELQQQQAQNMKKHPRESVFRISSEAMARKMSVQRAEAADQIVEEQEATLRELEAHQSRLASVHSEFRSTSHLLLTPTSIFDDDNAEEEESSAPLNGVHVSDKSQGRVSLMLRLESWRQQRMEEEQQEGEGSLAALEAAEARQSEWEDIQQAKQILAATESTAPAESGHSEAQNDAEEEAVDAQDEGKGDDYADSRGTPYDSDEDDQDDVSGADEPEDEEDECDGGTVVRDYEEERGSVATVLHAMAMTSTTEDQEGVVSPMHEPEEFTAMAVAAVTEPLDDDAGKVMGDAEDVYDEDDNNNNEGDDEDDGEGTIEQEHTRSTTAATEQLERESYMSDLTEYTHLNLKGAQKSIVVTDHHRFMSHNGDNYSADVIEEY